MPLFYVKIRKNIDICNYLPIYYPAICRGWGTFSVPSQGAGIHSRCALGGYDCAPFLEKDWNMDIIWAFSLPFGEG